jgi:hypothetical protein
MSKRLEILEGWVRGDFMKINDLLELNNKYDEIISKLNESNAMKTTKEGYDELLDVTNGGDKVND